ncbi:HAD-like domain-containing protein [Cyathus striatus]|nr:HAD-like domain-containing protein [Cyathus striatus]
MYLSNPIIYALLFSIFHIHQPLAAGYLSNKLMAPIVFNVDATQPWGIKSLETFAKDYRLGDSLTIAHATHGRRLYDTLKEYCGIEDEASYWYDEPSIDFESEKKYATRFIVQREVDRFEDEVIQGGPLILPGVAELLSQLNDSSIPWTIVTSASNKYAPRALERAGVPLPSLPFITSNDVSRGKPHPDPYLSGASTCGVEAKKCLVIEDAVSGLKSGRAAGSTTLAVCTSTARHVLLGSDASPDYVVDDLTKVKVSKISTGIEITLM